MHKFGVWSPTWGHHFLTETGQVCGTWGLTSKLGSWTSQKILSFLDLLVKVSNIIWRVHLTAECTERCRADGITGRYAATDVCSMLRSSALSRMLQRRWHYQSQCSNCFQLCTAQSSVKPSTAERVVPSVTMLHCTCLVHDCSIEQTVSLLLYFQLLNTFLYCIYQ